VRVLLQKNESDVFISRHGVIITPDDIMDGISPGVLQSEEYYIEDMLM
jgi:hypothetical protein